MGRRTGWTTWSGPLTSWCARWGRTDIVFTLIGSGDCFGELVVLRDELVLPGTWSSGWAPDEEVGRILSTADVGLSLDPKNLAERRIHYE